MLEPTTPDRATRRPRGVLFDLFHTLIVLRPGGDRGEPTWRALGLDRDAWNRSFFSEDDGRATGQVRGAVESLRLVAHRIDPSVPMERIEAAAAARERRFEDAFMNVAPEIVAGVARLHAADIRLGLVSNASWDEIGHWERSPLAPYFHDAVFSCAAGVAKPEPSIYRLAMESLDVPAEDAWFVGDGGSDEHRGAAAVGLHPVLVLQLLRQVWPEKIAARRGHARLVLESIGDVADAALAS